MHPCTYQSILQHISPPISVYLSSYKCLKKYCIVKQKEEVEIFICAALLRLKWEILAIRSGVFKQVGDDLRIKSEK